MRSLLDDYEGKYREKPVYRRNTRYNEGGDIEYNYEPMEFNYKYNREDPEESTGSWQTRYSYNDNLNNMMKKNNEKNWKTVNFDYANDFPDPGQQQETPIQKKEATPSNYEDWKEKKLQEAEQAPEGWKWLHKGAANPFSYGVNKILNSNPSLDLQEGMGKAFVGDKLYKEFGVDENIKNKRAIDYNPEEHKISKGIGNFVGAVGGYMMPQAGMNKGPGAMFDDTVNSISKKGPFAKMGKAMGNSTGAKLGKNFARNFSSGFLGDSYLSSLQGNSLQDSLENGLIGGIGQGVLGGAADTLIDRKAFKNALPERQEDFLNQFNDRQNFRNAASDIDKTIESREGYKKIKEQYPLNRAALNEGTPNHNGYLPYKENEFFVSKNDINNWDQYNPGERMSLPDDLEASRNMYNKQETISDPFALPGGYDPKLLPPTKEQMNPIYGEQPGVRMKREQKKPSALFENRTYENIRDKKVKPIYEDYPMLKNDIIQEINDLANSNLSNGSSKLIETLDRNDPTGSRKYYQRQKSDTPEHLKELYSLTNSNKYDTLRKVIGNTQKMTEGGKRYPNNKVVEKYLLDNLINNQKSYSAEEYDVVSNTVKDIYKTMEEFTTKIEDPNLDPSLYNLYIQNYEDGQQTLKDLKESFPKFFNKNGEFDFDKDINVNGESEILNKIKQFDKRKHRIFNPEIEDISKNEIIGYEGYNPENYINDRYRAAIGQKETPLDPALAAHYQKEMSKRPTQYQEAAGKRDYLYGANKKIRSNPQRNVNYNEAIGRKDEFYREPDFPEIKMSGRNNPEMIENFIENVGFKVERNNKNDIPGIKEIIKDDSPYKIDMIEDFKIKRPKKKEGPKEIEEIISMKNEPSIKEESGYYMDKGQSKSIKNSMNDKSNIVEKPITEKLEPNKMYVPGREPGQTKFYSETAHRNQSLSDSTKDFMIENQSIYEPLSNKKLHDKAQQMLEKDFNGTYNNVISKYRDNKVNVSPQDQVTGMKLAVGLDKAGKHEEAAELLDLISKRSTSLGQGIQTLAMFSRMTPEGMLKYADRLLKDSTASKFFDKQLRNGKDLKSDIRKMIVDRMEEIKNLSDDTKKAEETAKLLRDIKAQVPTTGAKWSDKLSSWNMLAMLGNPKTLLRNVLGNVGMTGIDTLSEQTVGRAADKVLSKFTGNKTIATMTPDEMKRALKQANIKTKQANKYIKEGIDPNNLDIKYQGGAWQNTKGVKGKAIRGFEKMVNKGLNLPDTHAFEYNKARAIENMMKAQGLKEPTEDILEAANNEALLRTFKDDNRFTNAGMQIQGAINKLAPSGLKLGQKVMPFVKTPANVLKRGMELTPVGLAQGIQKGVKLAKNGGTTADQRAIANLIGRGTIGTGLMGAGAALNKAGKLEGGPQGDKKEKAYRKALGIKNNAIKTGDKYVDVGFLAPLITPLLLGANLNQDKGKNVVSSFLGNSVDQILDMPFVKGVRDFMGALETDPETGSVNTEESFKKIAGNLANQSIPSLLGQTARFMNDNQKETYISETPEIDSIKAKIPGLANTLPDRINHITGEPYKNSIYDNPLLKALDVYVNPANTSKITNNQKALDILYNPTSFIPGKPTNNIPDTKKYAGVKLYGEDYENFVRTYGKEVNNLINKYGSKGDQFEKAFNKMKKDLYEDTRKKKAVKKKGTK